MSGRGHQEPLFKLGGVSQPEGCNPPTDEEVLLTRWGLCVLATDPALERRTVMESRLLRRLGGWPGTRCTSLQGSGRRLPMKCKSEVGQEAAYGA